MVLRLASPRSVAGAAVSTARCSTSGVRANHPVRHRLHRSIGCSLKAVPEGGEELTEAMKADLERYRSRQQQVQQASTPEPSSPGAFSGVKETLDKILIADFFLVLFVLAWLGAGVAQAGLSGGSSFLLDAWYPLWPLLWQPAIGILMAGALASGGMSWLQSQGQDKK